MIDNICFTLQSYNEKHSAIMSLCHIKQKKLKACSQIARNSTEVFFEDKRT